MVQACTDICGFVTQALAFLPMPDPAAYHFPTANSPTVERPLDRRTRTSISITFSSPTAVRLSAFQNATTRSEGNTSPPTKSPLLSTDPVTPACLQTAF